MFLLSLMALGLNCAMAQVDLDSTYKLSQLELMLSDARERGNQADLAATYFLLAEFEANNFDKSGNAFQNYAISRDYYKILRDSSMMSRIDKAIGLEYLQSGYYTEALESFEKALPYFEHKNDLKNVTYITYYISQVYRDKVDPEKELQYLNKAIKYNDVLKDSLLLVEFLIHKIGSYETLNELDSAELVAINTVTLSGEMRHRESMSKSLYYLGKINMKRGNLDRALKYMIEAEEFVSMKPYNEHRRALYKEISSIYERQEDYKSAYGYTQKYSILNDSILNHNRIESQNKFAVYYKTDQTQEDNKKLNVIKDAVVEKNKQQRNAMYILTAGLLMLLALVYYLINFYRQRIRAEEIINGQQQEISDQKIRELEDNIKISSMQSMLEGQEIERQRISQDLHDSLGGLLSTIKLQFDSVQAKMDAVGDLKEYKSANNMLDTAVQEVRSISQNLQPESLTKLGLIPALKDLFNRFDEDIYPEIDFQFYDVPDDIPIMLSLSIYRVIQELLHNTIKHAKATEILIQINTEGDELVIEFEDDGVGYDPENLKRKGMGLENIQSRITYFKGTIATDSNEGEGTSTLIHVRYK